MNFKEERPVPIRRVSDYVPGRPHISTVWRWINRGIRGHRLETMHVGGRRYTTEQAITRFLEKTQVPKPGSDHQGSCSPPVTAGVIAEAELRAAGY